MKSKLIVLEILILVGNSSIIWLLFLANLKGMIPHYIAIAVICITGIEYKLLNDIVRK
ncbi:hypothetical protein ERAN111884_07965 [Erysipelothrix anatis]